MYLPRSDHSDEPGHRLPFVDGVGEHAFRAGNKMDGLDGVLARNPVRGPFVAGYGRVGRMLIQQVFAGRLSIPAPVPVSVPWSRDTDGYIAGLRAFQDGDLDRWIEFACMSIVDAVQWMHPVEQRVSALITTLQERSRARGNSVAARVIRDLPTHPLVDVATVANRYGVSRQAALDALTRLNQEGVLGERSFTRKTKAGRPRRMFSNTKLIDLLAEIINR